VIGLLEGIDFDKVIKEGRKKVKLDLDSIGNLIQKFEKDTALN